MLPKPTVIGHFSSNERLNMSFCVVLKRNPSPVLASGNTVKLTIHTDIGFLVVLNVKTKPGP
jgi:hypothetical protein